MLMDFSSSISFPVPTPPEIFPLRARVLHFCQRSYQGGRYRNQTWGVQHSLQRRLRLSGNRVQEISLVFPKEVNIYSRYFRGHFLSTFSPAPAIQMWDCSLVLSSWKWDRLGYESGPPLCWLLAFDDLLLRQFCQVSFKLVFSQQQKFMFWWVLLLVIVVYILIILKI